MMDMPWKDSDFIPIDDAARDGKPITGKRGSLYMSVYWTGDMWAWAIPNSDLVQQADQDRTHYLPRKVGRPTPTDDDVVEQRFYLNVEGSPPAIEIRQGRAETKFRILKRFEFPDMDARGLAFRVLSPAVAAINTALTASGLQQSLTEEKEKNRALMALLEPNDENAKELMGELIYASRFALAKAALTHLHKKAKELS